LTPNSQPSSQDGVQSRTAQLRYTAPTVLCDEIIDRRGQRAAIYDRENRFFSEDFEELRQAGCLLTPIPSELGGLGMPTHFLAMPHSVLPAWGNCRAPRPNLQGTQCGASLDDEAELALSSA
jgi:alkylation response protein AidB-like acyl-CoA dehydrogenase